MSNQEIIGKTFDGEEVIKYTLTNGNGIKVEILNLGGIINSIFVPDRDGNIADVVLGFCKPEQYLNSTAYLGAVIGRVGNRIAKGKFSLNNKEYNLYINNEPNHLHGGKKGFDKRIFDCTPIGDNALELSLVSPDGEENYPGEVVVKVTYTLSDDGKLTINYIANSDSDTVLNLTNHAYFNLAGHDSGDILDHEIMINADKFTPVDSTRIPTGELRSVENTPMDFRTFKKIRLGIADKYDQIAFGNGYDHNYVLNTNGDLSQLCSEVYEPTSGRVMKVYTTKPGVQFYSGNSLTGADTGKSGKPYKKNAGLCLETQFFPNAINTPGFESGILKAGEVYNHTTIYQFLVK